MTGVSRWLLGVLVASAALLGSAASVVGQEGVQPMVLNGPDGPDAPRARPAPPPAETEADQVSAASTTDILTFVFIVASLAAGVIAVLVAARVYDRFRVDNPIIAAVNDPWVQNKIAQEMSAQPAAGSEVELSRADGPPPGHR